MNSIPQRTQTKYLLRELQAWARQIVRIKSILVFPQLFHLEIYQSIRGRRRVGWTNFSVWRGKRFSLTCPDRLCCPTLPRTHRVPGVGSLVVKQSEPKADSSFLSGTAVKNARSYTSAPRHILIHLNPDHTNTHRIILSCNIPVVYII